MLFRSDRGVLLVFSSCGASVRFLTRCNGKLREPFVWHQGPSSQHAGEKRGVAGLLLGRTERAALAPHERLSELPFAPRQKPHTGTTARENQQDAPVIAHTHGDLTSLAPHERLPKILVVPREKTPTGAAARGPRDLPNPGTESHVSCLLHWQAGSLLLAPPGEPNKCSTSQTPSLRIYLLETPSCFICYYFLPF